jgi:hypothetical protein
MSRFRARFMERKALRLIWRLPVRDGDHSGAPEPPLEEGDGGRMVRPHETRGYPMVRVQEQSAVRDLGENEIDAVSGGYDWGPIQFSFFGFLDCVFYGKNGANIARCTE